MSGRRVGRVALATIVINHHIRATAVVWETIAAVRGRDVHVGRGLCDAVQPTADEAGRSTRRGRQRVIDAGSEVHHVQLLLLHLVLAAIGEHVLSASHGRLAATHHIVQDLSARCRTRAGENALDGIHNGDGRKDGNGLLPQLLLLTQLFVVLGHFRLLGRAGVEHEHALVLDDLEHMAHVSTIHFPQVRAGQRLLVAFVFQLACDDAEI